MKKLFIPALALTAALSGCVVIDGSSGDGYGPAKYRSERLHQFQHFGCDNGFSVSIYRQNADYADFTYGPRGSDRNTFTVKPMSSFSGEYSVSDDRRIQWRQFDSGRAEFSFTDRGSRRNAVCHLAR